MVEHLQLTVCHILVIRNSILKIYTDLVHSKNGLNPEYHGNTVETPPISLIHYHMHDNPLL